MLNRIKRKLDRAWFNFRCAGIYATPPVKCDDTSHVVIISQLHHPDLTMYMLAAKSFAQYVKPRSFVIVDDGLNSEDKRILKTHFECIQFIPRSDMGSAVCPTGGCWERFLALAHENQAHYVIQLDADTLTLAEPVEVLQSIAAGRSFTLGTSSGTHFVGLSEASHHAHAEPHPHVQNHAERALVEYPNSTQLKYVRGCAGFTGFAPAKLSISAIETFSLQMQELVGRQKWHEWGSEQVASNFMVANVDDSLVLPVDRYPFWQPGLDIGRAVLIHFFGTFRFMGGMYTRQSLRIIQRLRT